MGIVVTSVAVDAPPAEASCVPPVVAFAGREGIEQARQGFPISLPTNLRATLIGRYWGDACNDTGTDDAPVLGDPADDITVSFHHGDVEQVLAEVDADECYAFEVTVALPFDDDQGAATLRVAAETPDGEIVVEREVFPTIVQGTTLPDLIPPPEAACDQLPRPSGGTSSGSSGSTGSSGSSDSSLVVPIAIGAVMVAVVGGLSAVLIRRRRAGA